MTVAEAVALYRQLAFDQAAGQLWSDPEILQLLDLAQEDAAVRGRLIRDDTTPEVCEIWLASEEARYQLHKAIFAFADEPGAVRIGDKWLTRAVGPRTGRTRCGIPETYWDTGKELILEPIPKDDSGNEPLSLDVYRVPLGRVTSMESAFELEARWHEGIVAGALARGFSKLDPDSYDRDLVTRWQAEFTRWFGSPVTANTLRDQRNKRPRVVRGAW